MPHHYRNEYGESVSFFHKSELRPMGQETEAERRLLELRERNEELNEALGTLDQDQEAEDDAAAIERENDRLERELEARTAKAKQLIGDQHMNTDLQALNTLDTLAKSATVDHHQLAKRCSDLMETRIDAIAKEHGVVRSEAHRIAAKSDGVYKRAYALHTQSHDQAEQQHSMIGGMGAHI